MQQKFTLPSPEHCYPPPAALKSFNEIKDGRKGIIQLLSLLPTSYPGHNILTEDMGEIVSSKSCVCSNKGKRFKVYGRNKDSEIRGCSDT